MTNKKFYLSKQLLKSVLVIYFLITLVVTLIHFLVEYSYTKSNIKNELKSVAKTFEPALNTALWDLNTEQLESISEGMVNMPLVYGLVITDPNNKNIIKKIDPSLSKNEMDDDELSYRFSIHQKFNNNNIYLANIVIYSDDLAIVNRIKVGFSMILINAIIKSTALIILFMIAFRNHLERPLQSLTQKISELQWENKTDRSIHIDFINKNELSVLQSKFNQLLSRISTEEDKRLELIKKQNIQLEYDVKNRTVELQKANEKLKILATTDVLTQLNNRSKIDEELVKQHDNFNRNKRVFSIIILDIDYFKNVNDTYGHQIGDYVLKTISMILKENTRSIDMVGRWGGEEFLIVCTETYIDGAYAMAENLRTSIEAYKFEYIEHITISLGISQIKEDMSIFELIKKTDKALYQAKDEGRNRSIKA
ncbi:GGDEF domain-containing protein [Sulfurimonas sp.]